MSETTATTEASAEETATEPTPATPKDVAEATSGKADETPEQTIEGLRAALAKANREAKDNRTKAKEYDEQRKAAMTDAERAVAEAEERGRTAAATEFGRELARERFDALAGRRNASFDTAKALEFVDLSKFLGEDGRPDAKVIAAAVERLVPASNEPTPSFDGGTRTPPPVGVDMNTALRKATGRA